MKTEVANAHIAQFGTSGVFCFAPGRANLIGEHTDYNGGYVLPFAIQKGIWIAATKNDNKIIEVKALNVDQTITIVSIDDYIPSYGWDKFIHQILILIKEEINQGFSLTFGGDLPIGAGLSSSSTLTCGFIFALNSLFEKKWSHAYVLDLAVTAERGYGVQGGIMDQFSILFGLRNKAVLLDCKDNSSTYVPLELDGNQLVLFNTNVAHNLIETEYNSRHNECQQTLVIMQKLGYNLKYLSQLTLRDLDKHKTELGDPLHKRATYVIEETLRVIDFVKKLEEKDFNSLGKLLYESHEGLSNKYEVSCPELDWLVERTKLEPNIYGARMMGGGFGGCTINLISPRLKKEWVDNLLIDYYNRFHKELTIIPIAPSNGLYEMGSA